MGKGQSRASSVPCHQRSGKRRRILPRWVVVPRFIQSAFKQAHQCSSDASHFRELVAGWCYEDLRLLVEHYESLLHQRQRRLEQDLFSSSARSFEDDMASLMSGGLMADIVLDVNGVDYPCHCAMLYARSLYFRELPRVPGDLSRITVPQWMSTSSVNAGDVFIRYVYRDDVDIPVSRVSRDIIRTLGTGRSIEQDMEWLLGSGCLSDLTLVFSEPTSVPGECQTCKLRMSVHRFVLASRSSYFHSLLTKRPLPSEELVLDPAIFPARFARIVLLHIYTGAVDLSGLVDLVSISSTCPRSLGRGYLDYVMDLYELSLFLDLSRLVEACESAIYEELSSDTLVSIVNWVQSSEGFSRIRQNVFRYIEEEYLNLARSPAFNQLPQSFLRVLLQSDYIQASEADILDSLIRWGEHQVLHNFDKLDLYPGYASRLMSTKQRMVDNWSLKLVLSELMPLVRVHHILPPRYPALATCIQRDLVCHRWSLDQKELYQAMMGSSLTTQSSCNWIGSQLYGRSSPKPRLFIPYYQEAKTILRERGIAYSLNCRSGSVQTQLPDIFPQAGVVGLNRTPSDGRTSNKEAGPRGFRHSFTVSRWPKKPMDTMRPGPRRSACLVGEPGYKQTPGLPDVAASTPAGGHCCPDSNPVSKTVRHAFSVGSRTSMIPESRCPDVAYHSLPCARRKLTESFRLICPKPLASCSCDASTETDRCN